MKSCILQKYKFLGTLVIIHIVYNFLHFNVKIQVGKFFANSKFEIFVQQQTVDPDH